MPEEAVKTDVEEAASKGDVAETEDSVTSEDSSTEKTEDQETSSTDDTSATEDASADSETSDDGKGEDGSPIPYDRFKNVNDEKNRAIAELDEIRGQLQSPKVLRALMEERGYTEDKIRETLKEAGHEISNAPPNKQTEELVKGLDLNKQEDWIELVRRVSELTAQQTVAPIQQQVQQNKKRVRSRLK